MSSRDKYVSVTQINGDHEKTQRRLSDVTTNPNSDHSSQSSLEKVKNTKFSRKLSFKEDQIATMIPERETSPQAVVIVKDVVQSFGGPKVLNKFSMNVQKGTIYSLLGSSGCGKTTLLSCIVGIRGIESGEILIYGAHPGTKESGVPGKRVGFMPQEIALYKDFSISESFKYFGALFGMTSSEIKTSQDFLMKFLYIPPDLSKRVGHLSGGQQRRMSLAIALIHSPDLLILDEPTVGVDPLLRESIWKHLCNLVSTRGTTVIITTHYIEEARQSTTVGMMRKGRLVAEESPDILLQKYNTNLLEDVFLKLCKSEKAKSQSALPGPDAVGVDEIAEISNEEAPIKMMEPYILENVEDPNTFLNTVTRIRALALKNGIVIMRNLLLVGFMVLFPAVEVAVVCIAIGNDPTPLYFGVVNKETSYTETCLKSTISQGGCDVENLSCQFLSQLPNDTIYLREYETEEKARESVKIGRNWGFMVFPEGYSDNLYTRSSSGNIIDNNTIEGSQIYLEMDYSNKQISSTIKRIIGDAYKDFIRQLLTNCGFHPELGEPPVKFLTPIYGNDDTDFREFVAPSFLVGILFFLPLVSSGVSYIWDKKQGTMERARIAGVRTSEIIISFVMSEGAILLIQSSIAILITIVVFKIEVRGSILLAISLPILMGLSGLSMGFLIASFCNEEIEAVMLAMASFFPNFILAGLLWPVESMPLALKYFSYCLPCTLACEAFRSIISRGWGFTHPNVWPGFVVTFMWLMVYWGATIIVHKHLLRNK